MVPVVLVFVLVVVIVVIIALIHHTAGSGSQEALQTSDADAVEGTRDGCPCVELSNVFAVSVFIVAGCEMRTQQIADVDCDALAIPVVLNTSIVIFIFIVVIVLVFIVVVCHLDLETACILDEILVDRAVLIRRDVLGVAFRVVKLSAKRVACFCLRYHFL